MRSWLKSAFLRGAGGAVVALVLAWGIWHLYTDHVSLHRGNLFWNTYGPLLERARLQDKAQQEKAQQQPARRDPPPSAPSQ
ncbi:MAG: hypothetical protein Q7R41_14610 [Phycisphaerales bacterium]|nr:hypothetical protein [Phycisphaerales bacterium]